MVSAYVQLIDRNCPTGSLRLLGFSFGGVLAMETARLLEEKGRHVAFIALIEFEPQWFSKRTNRNPMLSAIAVELLQHLRSESHVLLEVPKDLIESKIAKAMETVVVKGPAATVSELKEWFVRSGFVFIGSRGDALSEYLTRVATHVVLAHGIESLQTVHSPLFVWKATRGLMVDDTSWETLSRGEVQLRVLEGDHFDAVAPPNCEAIAQQLESL